MHDAPLSRRRFLKGAAAAASAVAAAPLYACGGSNNQGGQTSAGGAGATAATGEGAAPTTAAKPQSAGLQKVRAMMWSNTPTMDANFKNRVKAFNQANQGKYEVDLQLLPYDQYWQKLQLAYSANDPYDTYFWDVQAYGHFKKGLLLDLEPYVDSSPGLLDPQRYPAKLFDVWKLDGARLYALPENLQSMAFYYNKDIFDKAGIEYPSADWTWDDVLEAGRELTIRQGDKVTQWGLDLGAVGAWWGAQTFSWSQGSAFFDKIVEPTKFRMQEEPNVRTLQFLQDLIHKHKIVPTAAQRQAAAQDIGIFQSGKCAMIGEGSWNISSYQQLKFGWDMAPLPKFGEQRVQPYWLGGWVVAKASKVPEAAFAFARWNATDFQDTMAKQHDWIPLLNEARQSEAFTAGMPAGFNAAFEAIEQAKLGDLYHRNNQQIVGEVFGPALDQLYNNKLTPELVAKQIDQKGNALLK